MIRPAFILAFVILLGAFSSRAQVSDWKQKIAPQVLNDLQQHGKADCFIFLQEQADVSGARAFHTKTDKASFVVARLRETAARTQVNLNRMLHENGAFSNSFYLINAVSVENMDWALAQKIAEMPEVARLAPDPQVKFEGPIEPSVSADQSSSRSAIEWGIEKINAPAVWAMGYTGQGITVGGSDTGYDWVHPAIMPHYRGYDAANATADHAYNWHDAIHELSPLNGDTTSNPWNNPCGLDSPGPCDDGSHGTHTMGTMTGDDGQGNQIGVAPGAKWIGCRNMERGWGKPSTYIECLQWFIAPTDLSGQNADVTKAPHVINNSWYCADIEGCTDLTVNELLRTAIINLRASGVVVVVSNGNSGWSCGSTSNAPAYFEESFSVGATRDDDAIASFSSRGPVLVDNSGRMKPNVSAPGQNVRSCVINGGYANYSGTSMAGPHVAGMVALVLSARPDLAGEVELIEDIIEKTAFYLADTTDCGVDSPGDARPNHAYGFGRINALAAVSEALAVVSAPVIGGTAAVRAVVFPNPVLDEAIFDVQNVEGKTILEVYNAAGQVVFSKYFSPNNRELLKVSMGNMPLGMYFWTVRNEKGIVGGKLVKG